MKCDGGQGVEGMHRDKCRIEREMGQPEEERTGYPLS
jgi:hypothetical protein